MNDLVARLAVALLAIGINSIAIFIAWNFIAPVFNMPEINPLHAVCIYVLTSYVSPRGVAYVEKRS